MSNMNPELLEVALRPLVEKVLKYKLLKYLNRITT